MSKSLSLAVIASLLFGACVINDSDDDDVGETSSASSNTTTSPTTTSPTTTSPTTSTSSSDDSESSGVPETTTDTPADSGSSSSAETTSTPTGPCGWGDTGQKPVAMGYICGGDGADPEDLNPIECPARIELTEGGDCGGDMGITGVGCCDGSGNVWFCADNGGGRVLYTEICGG